MSVSKVCEIYLSAEELSAENTHVYSTDEKIGIQDKEHVNPKQLMLPGQAERVDPEYIRHGRTGLIASRNVATGEIVMPLIQPTSTEDDFANHIEQVISVHSGDKHIFTVDNLNTHMSESLVRLVADICGIDELEVKLRNFIDYYNQFLKKPFQWNYKGKSLKI